MNVLEKKESCNVKFNQLICIFFKLNKLDCTSHKLEKPINKKTMYHKTVNKL
jgi:hypothetical protein